MYLFNLSVNNLVNILYHIEVTDIGRSLLGTAVSYSALGIAVNSVASIASSTSPCRSDHRKR